MEQRSSARKEGSDAHARRRVGALLLATAAAAAGCAHAARPQPPAPAPSESGRLLQDLRYALAVLEAGHPRLDHAVPLERFHALLDQLEARSPTLSREEAFFALMRLVALAGDAHTRLASWEEIADPRLPLSVTSWSDGLWVEAVGPQASELWGSRIVSVGGQRIDEVTRRLAPLVPHDNEIVLAQGVAALLSLPRALAHVGLADDASGATLGLLAADGVERDLRVEARPAAELRSWVFPVAPGWSAPLWRGAAGEPWRWCVLEEERALYLRYNRCWRREQSAFAELVRDALARWDRGDLQRFVVDLRLNAGGDSEVVAPLLSGLRRRGLRGDALVVAIGSGTFSSGMLAAHRLSQELDALLVGEPTAQKPDGFGELREAVLPESGWRVQYSTKRFRLFGDERPSLAPDVLVEHRFADLVRGRDPLVDWLRGQLAAPR